MSKPEIIILGGFMVVVVIIFAYFYLPRTSSTDGDAEVLEQLRIAGSDLEKPHKIDFYLYFATREAAETAKSELDSTLFSVQIDTAATGSDWLCLATREMVPKHEQLLAIRNQLSELAKKHAGQYDGWETTVVK